MRLPHDGCKVTFMSSISPEFSARLKRLDPQQRMRVIVVLRTAGPPVGGGRRQSPAHRLAQIETMRCSAEQALKEIDGVLERFHGRRLSAEVNALGTVPVETTVAGVKALASSDQVKAVLENQPVALVEGQRPRS
jgi:hypothetical protein